MVFLSALPSLGLGRLANRENPRMLNTEQEHTLLSPVTDFYRKTAAQFIRYQISVSMYLFSELYTDVASLAPLAENLGGQVYFYPAFQGKLDGAKFQHDLQHELTRPTGWEAVIRIRVSHGLKIKKGRYHGACSIKGDDLLQLPCLDSDKSFTVELVKDDKPIVSHRASIQVALLYTTSWGERRIRVHNAILAVSAQPSVVYASVNASALIAAQCKAALATLKTQSLQQLRTSLRAHSFNLLAAMRNSGQVTQEMGNAVASLPIACLGLIKSKLFRPGTDLRPDNRAWLQRLAYSMDVNQLELFLRPRLMKVSKLKDNEGLEGKDCIDLPNEVPLSCKELSSNDAFLLDNGVEMWLWLGEDVDQKWENLVLDVDSMELRTPADHDTNSDSKRVSNIVAFLRELSCYYQPLTIVREGHAQESELLSLLIQDEGDHHQQSFETFMAELNRKTNFYN